QRRRTVTEDIPGESGRGRDVPLVVMKPVLGYTIDSVADQAVQRVVIGRGGDGAVVVHDGSLGRVVLRGFKQRLEARLRRGQGQVADAGPDVEGQPACRLDAVFDVWRNDWTVDVGPQLGALLGEGSGVAQQQISHGVAGELSGEAPLTVGSGE